MDLSPAAEPHVWAKREARHVHLDLAVEDVRMGPEVGLQRADILPVAASHITVQRPTRFEHHGEHFGGEIDGPAGGYPVEDFRLQHVDAGVDRDRKSTRLNSS